MKIPFLSQGKPEPVGFEQKQDAEIDRINGELAAITQQRAQADADSAELDRLDTIDAAAAQEVTASEAELRRQHDPLVELDAPPDAKANAQTRVRAAREAKRKYTADRGAFGHTRETIAARVTELNAREVELQEDLGRAQRRKAAYRYLVALFQVYDCVNDSNLPEAVDFPSGVFLVKGDQNHSGGNALTKTIFYDHVLRSFAEHYPEILQAVAAEDPDRQRDVDHATWIVRRHEEKRAAGPIPPARWKPNTFNNWRP